MEYQHLYPDPVIGKRLMETRLQRIRDAIKSARPEPDRNRQQSRKGPRQLPMIIFAQVWPGSA